MSQLQALKSATSLQHVAALLEFTPSALAYILYKKPAASKYHSFEIRKRNGGVRQINAPCDELMLLQRRLCDLLQNCADDINIDHKWKDELAHGFKRKRSIMTNARKHRRRRFVLNLDLQDFFGTINFGRVRGFFIKNTDFALHEAVATVIAQIACHEDALPQGSPCSPIISNLIGGVLDVRLCRLASKSGCTYSRYADDITFSTNEKEFPPDLAKQVQGEQHQWEIGEKLEDILKRTGFTPNPQKTRLQYRASRQDVTGLVVNKKVNIRSEYRRNVRAMVHRLFMTGHFQHIQTVPQADGTLASVSTDGTLAQLHGMLGHIWGVDLYNWRIRVGLKTDEPVTNATDADVEVLSSKEKLYRRFLTYKEFYAASAPTIVCEGKTDNIYLKHAIRSLAPKFPTMAAIVESKPKLKVRIFRYPDTSTGRILELTGGSGDLKNFVGAYSAELTRFKAPAMKHPVILLIDQDKGATDLFNLLRGKFKKKFTTDDPFVHAFGNLYVVPTPLAPGKAESVIEDCFSDGTKAIKLENKSFNPKKGHLDNEHYYAKHIFAQYIEKNADKIDFSGFAELLTRIAAVIEDHKNSLFIPNVDQAPATDDSLKKGAVAG